MRKYFLIGSTLLFLLGCIFLYQYIIYNDKKLHLVICDVGQGDAVFMRTPNGSDILIDGGPDDSVLACLGRHMPFWDKTIELVMLTHPHADHMTGLMDVLKRYRMLSFGYEKTESPTGAYRKLIDLLEQNRVKQIFLWQGDRFVLGEGIIFETLWPTKEWFDQNSITETSSDANDFSMIELLTYNHFKALFTGDAQASAMKKIDLMAGKIDVLKVPHHGSQTGLDSQILDILNPKLAAISVGAKNKYGHPTPFILNLLKSKNIKTLRTDQIGDIEIVSDGTSWEIN
jgi:competence protein ComEC